jgi:hypothetical protein
VIGNECLEHRMAVDMIWPMEHGVFRARPEGKPSGEDDQQTLIKTGNYVDSRLHMLLQEKVQDSPITLEIARKIKENYAFVSSPT